ncbi:acyl carrier protein [Streptomyces sp. M19]
MPPAEDDADAASALTGDPERVLAMVRSQAALVLGYDADATDATVDPDRTLLELGIDSMGAVRLQQRLTAATGLELPPTLLIDHPTPAALADHLCALLPDPERPRDKARTGPRPARERARRPGRLLRRAVALGPRPR